MATCSDDLPFSQRWLVMGMPLHAALLSEGCFFYAFSASGAKFQKQIDWDALLTAPTELEGPPEGFAAQTMWCASAYALLVLSVSLIIVAGLITTESRTRESQRQIKIQFGIIAGLVILAGGATLLFTDAIQGRPWEHLLLVIEGHTGNDIQTLFELFTRAYPVVGMLAAVGFCATLVPVAEGSRDGRVLARALNCQRLLLYTMALVLAVAVAQMNYLWSWPRAWAIDDGAAARIDELALRVSIAHGSIMTIMILVMFSSAHVTLRSWIGRYATEKYADPKERLEQLESEGLSSSWREQLSQAIAVLGPLLAGGPVAALVQSLGSAR